MTDDQLPSGPTDDRDRLPARQDPNTARALATNYRGGGALSLDLLDDRREADPDEIDLLAYWHILVKRRRLIAGVLAGVVAIALLLTLMTQPMYRASALMQVEKEGPPIVATQGAMPFYDGWDPEFLNTQYELLRSRAMAERVAKEVKEKSGGRLDVQVFANSQLGSGKQVASPAEVVYEGMHLDMRVLEVDPIHRRIVLSVTNIPEEQPPRPETPSKVIPMESEHDLGGASSYEA